MWIDRVFAAAHRDGSAGVVIGLEAGMWDPEAIGADAASGFTPIVKRLDQSIQAFQRPRPAARGRLPRLQGR